MPTSLINAASLRSRLTLTPGFANRIGATGAPGVILERPPRFLAPTPPVAPPAPPPPAVAPVPAAALPTLPPVPDDNPFNHLPFPAPGDRIRAEDFRQLSLCLQLVQATSLLSAALFGQTLSAARPFLAAQGRTLTRIMTVFGTVLDDPNNTSLDQRPIIQVLPVIIGEPEVQVIVSEAVETRRLSPSLVGFNYETAARTLSSSIGQGAIAAAPTRVPSLTDIALGDAANVIATNL
jgi:hypothetical protein